MPFPAADEQSTGVADTSDQTRPGSGCYDRADGTERCFLCGQPDYRLVYRIEHFGVPVTFQRCRCGLVKQTPMPNEQFFEWFFNSSLFLSSRRTEQKHIWGYYDYLADEPSRMATSRYRYRKLAHLFDRGPLTMMKIGPATGTFLHVATQHGHSATGCDVSNEFTEYARATYGVHVDEGRFERMGYPDAQFDVVLLFNVIENVPNLAEFMQEIARTIKPDGYFILNVVDMHHNVIALMQRRRYFLYRPPVCYIFTLPVLKRMLSVYGFDVVEVHRDIRHMHLEKIATLLGWRWLHQVGNLLRLGRRSFPIYAYPSRVVVARRRD